MHLIVYNVPIQPNRQQSPETANISYLRAGSVLVVLKRPAVPLFAHSKITEITTVRKWSCMVQLLGNCVIRVKRFVKRYADAPSGPASVHSSLRHTEAVPHTHINLVLECIYIITRALLWPLTHILSSSTCFLIAACVLNIVCQTSVVHRPWTRVARSILTHHSYCELFTKYTIICIAAVYYAKHKLYWNSLDQRGLHTFSSICSIVFEPNRQ